MVEVKVGIETVDAASVSQHETKFERYTDDGWMKVVTIHCRVDAPGVNLREHIGREVERQEAAEYGPDPPQIDVRSYSEYAIGEQDPMGHYEEWEFHGDESVTFTMTRESVK